MNRHYNRYTSFRKPSRWKPVLVLLAALLIIFLLFKLAGIGGINEDHFETQRNVKLRSEAHNALTCTNSLSRLGASTTSSVLGKIRQYVHGIEVINDLNVSMYGEVGRLYPQSTFSDIYGIIEGYDALLITGQKVNEALTSLSEAINSLNERTLEIISGTP